jgi:hypothetical protein
VTGPALVRVERLPETGGGPSRFGRHIEHDTRSLPFAAPVLPRSAILSVHWPRAVGPFDQGADITVAGVVYHGLSSCTGNAAVGWLATANSTRPGLATFRGRPVDEALAVQVYCRGTALDRFPGRFPTQDTGSSGIAVVKALVELGAAAGYRHGFSLQAALSGLQAGPVLAGVPWFGSMNQPDADGRIRVDMSSGLVSGHEICVDRLDMQAGRVWFTNSWGPDWCIGGGAWLTLEDFGRLLSADGDVTIPQPMPVLQPGAASAAPAGCLGQLVSRFTRKNPPATA